MVSISAVRAANAQVSQLKTSTTAIFVGGTSGIGRATLLELARRKTKSLRVYIIGRNASSQQDLLNQLREINPKGDFIFLETQITLLAEVKRVCDEIKTREKSIDLLWLSAGALPFDGRKETSEGLSMHMTLGYWGRMFFITLLLPQLKASSANPRVISILRAGSEHADLDLSDLDIKKFTTKSAYVDQYAAAAETMGTLFLERLAQQNPEVVFIHKFPGLLKTGIFSQGWGTSWSARRVLFTYVVPHVASVVGLSEEEVGNRGVYDMFSARFGGSGIQSEGEKPLTNSVGGLGCDGAFLIKEDDETVKNAKVLEKLRQSGAPNRIYEETNKVFAPFL
ncbi:hypothetical protein F5884DRAFT_780728 [Xylogone sp. PMI_703]|nr:hypothetical protein F5884DRAFT_780728 [Xylogone sp. PMI_703]